MKKLVFVLALILCGHAFGAGHQDTGYCFNSPLLYSFNVTFPSSEQDCRKLGGIWLAGGTPPVVLSDGVVGVVTGDSGSQLEWRDGSGTGDRKLYTISAGKDWTCAPVSVWPPNNALSDQGPESATFTCVRSGK